MLRASVVGLLIVLLTIMVACGEEATPTEEPAAATTAATTAPVTASAASPGATTKQAASAATQASVAATTATPAAAPTPAPAQPPTAMMEATGSLDFATPELSPLISDLANMPYGVFRFLNKTTHEAMWDTNNDGTLRPPPSAGLETRRGPG